MPPIISTLKVRYIQNVTEEANSPFRIKSGVEIARVKYCIVKLRIQ